MKKVFAGAMGVLAVVVTVANLQQSVYADPAIVIHNNGICGMVGADADGGMTFGGLGTQTLVIENKTKVMLKCTGDGIENLSGRGQHFDDFACGVLGPDGGFILAADSHATVSADGSASMTCTYKK
jgi:hypothetical protein